MFGVFQISMLIRAEKIKNKWLQILGNKSWGLWDNFWQTSSSTLNKNMAKYSAVPINEGSYYD